MRPQMLLKASLLKQLFEWTLACPWSTQDPYTCGFLCLECFPSPQPGHSNLSSKSQFRGHYLLAACPGSLNLGQSLCDPLPSWLIHLTAHNTLWHLPFTRLDQHWPTGFLQWWKCSISASSKTVATNHMWLLEHLKYDYCGWGNKFKFKFN